jgi:P-type Mg2+ transporter
MSADIILLEKSLAVLGNGVIEGRKVFGNITKYIKMGASSNFGNMFSVLGASVFLPFLPMTAIQVLTNNLLYDFSQTTIPTDNVDAEYVAVPRRWDIGNITKFVLFIGPISSIFDYAMYFTMLYVFEAWNNPALFQTGWFVESLLTQTLIIHIIRTAKFPFLESRASTALITMTIGISAIGIALPFSWLGSFLGFVPLHRAIKFFERRPSRALPREQRAKRRSPSFRGHQCAPAADAPREARHGIIHPAVASSRHFNQDPRSASGASLIVSTDSEQF